MSKALSAEKETDESRLHKSLVLRLTGGGGEEGATEPTTATEGTVSAFRGCKDDLRTEARKHTDAAEVERIGKLKGLGWCFNITPFEETDFAHVKGMLREMKDSDLPLALKMMCNQAPTLVNFGLAQRNTGVPTDTKCPLCKSYRGNNNNNYNNAGSRYMYNASYGDSTQQSLFHVLNGCPFSLDSGRYTKRHDDVLRVIAERLKTALAADKKGSDDSSLWVDLEGLNGAECYPEHIGEDLREQYRPDIMMVKAIGSEAKKLIMIELSCPFETVDNLKNAHQRKSSKYERFVDAVRAGRRYAEVELHCIEVGSRGYIANTFQEIHPYLNCGRGHPKITVFRRRVGRASLMASLRIFRNRDKPALAPPEFH